MALAAPGVDTLRHEKYLSPSTEPSRRCRRTGIATTGAAAACASIRAEAEALET